MKALVTGADGQLGRALRQAWPEAVFTTRAELDLSWPASRLEDVVLGLKPNVLVNCAAYTAVDKAETDQEMVYRINTLAAGSLASACAAVGGRFIQISTDYVFGNDGKQPLAEDDQPKPRSHYGYSKLFGEALARLCPQSCVVRTSWVFGEGPNFVRTMLRLAESKEEVAVVHDQIGRPAYAQDLAESIRQLAELPAMPATIHLQNSGQPTSWAQFAEEIFRQTETSTGVRRITTDEYLASRQDEVIAPRPRNSVFSLKLAEALGLKLRPWQDALTEYLATTAPT